MAAEIRDWINEHCWSPRKQSYTMHPGSDDLDAAVLLMARTGFCHGDQQRLQSTIDAIRTELTATEPLLYRYSAMRGKEGAFAACTFWLAEALARTGRPDQARPVFDAMLNYCNDVGLLAKEIDPATGAFLGNFPARPVPPSPHQRRPRPRHSTQSSPSAAEHHDRRPPMTAGPAAPLHSGGWPQPAGASGRVRSPVPQATVGESPGEGSQRHRRRPRCTRQEGQAVKEPSPGRGDESGTAAGQAWQHTFTPAGSAP